MEVAYRNTVAHLDDLRCVSRKASDLLEEMNEQEWKNNHVAYRINHSVSLFFVASVIFAYLLYKLYTCARNRTTVWFCGEKAPVTPTDVSYVVMLLDKMNKRALLTLMAEAVGQSEHNRCCLSPN